MCNLCAICIKILKKRVYNRLLCISNCCKLSYLLWFSLDFLRSRPCLICTLYIGTYTSYFHFHFHIIFFFPPQSEVNIYRANQTVGSSIHWNTMNLTILQCCRLVSSVDFSWTLLCICICNLALMNFQFDNWQNAAHERVEGHPPETWNTLHAMGIFSIISWVSNLKSRLLHVVVLLPIDSRSFSLLSLRTSIDIELGPRMP